MNHEYYTAKDCPDCRRSSFDLHDCNICDGGLAICKICNLAEGELTTECPGEDASQFGKETYAGNIDFVGGKWVGTRLKTERAEKLERILEEYRGMMLTGKVTYTKDSEEYKILQDWLEMEYQKAARADDIDAKRLITKQQLEIDRKTPKPFSITEWIER